MAFQEINIIRSLAMNINLIFQAFLATFQEADGRFEIFLTDSASFLESHKVELEDEIALSTCMKFLVNDWSNLKDRISRSVLIIKAFMNLKIFVFHVSREESRAISTHKHHYMLITSNFYLNKDDHVLIERV